MSDTLIEQLQTVLADQKRQLKDLRVARRKESEKLAELDAQEVEVLLGIKQAKALLEQHGAEYYADEGDR